MPGAIHELGPKELAALKKRAVRQRRRKFSTYGRYSARPLGKRVDQSPLCEVSESVLQSLEQQYDEQIKTAVDALDESKKQEQEKLEAKILKEYEQLAEEYIEADAERQRLGVDENTYAIYTVLRLVVDNKKDAVVTAKDINSLFTRFHDYQWDGKQGSELRIELYKMLRPVVGSAKMIEVTNTLMMLQRV